MTHRERFLSAVSHREPDRIPLCMDAEKEVWPKLSAALGVRTQEECYQALEIDEWMLDPKVTDPRARRISPTESLSQWGYHIREVKTAYGSYGDICAPPLTGPLTASAIDKFDWPDPAQINFNHYGAKMKEMGERAYIAHITHGPYFNCTNLRGMEAYLMDMAMEPDLAKRLMDRTEAYIQNAIDNLLTNARPLPDVYYIADDFCSSNGPLFSPATWREWVKPYLERMANKVHARGLKFMLHVCGSVRPYIPDLIEAGVDILEPVQTTARGMELKGLKKDFGKDITFYGSIDTHHLLPKGSVQEVVDEVKRTLDIMAPGGGFIIGPAHTYIQPDTPVANIIALYRTAVEYGTY
ncbi:MAG: uroporphyrinogen decarboxylase family protein [Fibrobacterota bacterium]